MQKGCLLAGTAMMHGQYSSVLGADRTHSPSKDLSQFCWFFFFFPHPTAYRKAVCHDTQAEYFPNRNAVDSRTRTVQFTATFPDVCYQILQNI